MRLTSLTGRAVLGHEEGHGPHRLVGQLAAVGQRDHVLHTGRVVVERAAPIERTERIETTTSSTTTVTPTT